MRAGYACACAVFVASCCGDFSAQGVARHGVETNNIGCTAEGLPRCCKAAPLDLLRCASGQEPSQRLTGSSSKTCKISAIPSHAAAQRLLIVTHVSPEVEHYGRYSAAVNAAWADRFGHRMNINTSGRPTDGRQFNMAFASIMRDVVRTGPKDGGWVLRLDCDAVLANFREDFLLQITLAHPKAEVIISKGENQFVLDKETPFNFGVVLFKRSSYVATLLDKMLSYTSGVDQEVFTSLWQSNWNGLRGVTVVLPETAMNSGMVTITSEPDLQPIYHFWGHLDDVRTFVLKEAFTQLCAGNKLLLLKDAYLRSLQVSAQQANVSAAQVSGNDINGSNFRSQLHLAAALRHFGDTRGEEAALRAGLSAAGPISSSVSLKAIFAYSSLISLLEKQGRLDEVFFLASDALSICDEVEAVIQEISMVQQTREECARQLIYFGILYRERGRITEAVPYLKGGLARLERAGSSTLDISRATAALLSVQSDVSANAISLMQDAVKGAEQNLNETDGERLVFRAQLVWILERAGRFHEAALEARSVLFGMAGKSGNWDPAGMQFVLHALSLATGRARGGPQGLELLRVGVSMSPASSWWRRELGLALAEQGHLAEAESHLARVAKAAHTVLMDSHGIRWQDVESELAAIRRKTFYRGYVESLAAGNLQKVNLEAEAAQAPIGVFVVTAASELYRQRVKQARATWALGRSVLFFAAAADQSLDIRGTSCTDDHSKGVCCKTIEGFRQALVHFPRASWFVRAVDDTFVFIDQLVLELQAFNPAEFLYIGAASTSLMCNFPDYSRACGEVHGGGGAGVILSRPLAERLVKHSVQFLKSCTQDDSDLGHFLRYAFDVHLINLPGIMQQPRFDHINGAPAQSVVDTVPICPLPLPPPAFSRIEDWGPIYPVAPLDVTRLAMVHSHPSLWTYLQKIPSAVKKCPKGTTLLAFANTSGRHVVGPHFEGLTNLGICLYRSNDRLSTFGSASEQPTSAWMSPALATLHWAAAHGHDTVILEMCATGCAVNELRQYSGLPHFWGHLVSPLHLAAVAGHVKSSQALIAARADPSLISQPSGLAPLEWASSHVKVAPRLVDLLSQHATSAKPKLQGGVRLKDLLDPNAQVLASKTLASTLHESGFVRIQLSEGDGLAVLLKDIFEAQRRECAHDLLGKPGVHVNVFDRGPAIAAPPCWGNKDLAPLLHLHGLLSGMAAMLLAALAEGHKALKKGGGAWLGEARRDTAAKQQLLRSFLYRHGQEGLGQWSHSKPHQDASWVTLLAEAGLPGLHVRSADSSWQQVQTQEARELLLFVGAQLSAASKGFFPAACHAVRRPDQGRYRLSWAFLSPTNICQYSLNWSRQLAGCHYAWHSGSSFPEDPADCDGFALHASRVARGVVHQDPAQQ